MSLHVILLASVIVGGLTSADTASKAAEGPWLQEAANNKYIWRLETSTGNLTRCDVDDGCSKPLPPNSDGGSGPWSMKSASAIYVWRLNSRTGHMERCSPLGCEKFALDQSGEWSLGVIDENYAFRFDSKSGAAYRCRMVTIIGCTKLPSP